ncbi:MAG: 4Fe-4S dicluster domain-containing protein [Oscillospiraceae bacterium]|jgi:carbon-monoxide dehydrogenase iron sulfur subunit|nr:4Fe-4S dicluster domain-containing protein [Oscillospiraceae bacterium]
MKKVYVNEEWCLGCHLCEYYCAGMNSGERDLVKAFSREKKPLPRIRVEEGTDVNFAVQCRHCAVPYCVKGCITGALSVNDGVIVCDQTRCVGCLTCVLSCPYGCIVRDEEAHVITKCDLCLSRNATPACVEGCPNKAIVLEDRE